MQTAAGLAEGCAGSERPAGRGLCGRGYLSASCAASAFAGLCGGVAAHAAAGHAVLRTGCGVAAWEEELAAVRCMVAATSGPVAAGWRGANCPCAAEAQAAGARGGMAAHVRLCGHGACACGGVAAACDGKCGLGASAAIGVASAGHLGICCCACCACCGYGCRRRGAGRGRVCRGVAVGGSVTCVEVARGRAWRLALLLGMACVRCIAGGSAESAERNGWDGDGTACRDCFAAWKWCGRGCRGSGNEAWGSG